jgi:protease PrsW
MAELFLVVISFVIIAGGLTWFLLANNHGHKESVATLWLAGLLGFLAVIAAGLLEHLLINPKILESGSSSLSTIFVASLGVGVIEESLKFIPLAIFIFNKPFFNTHRDGVIYFAIAGIGFGLPENIIYTLSFGASTGVTRILLTPLFHAAVTGMVGYFLAKAKVEGKSIKLPVIALLGAMLIHGLYDFGLSSGNNLLNIMSLVITTGMTATLFILFLLAGESDTEEGLMYSGKNNFCKFCGYPNSNHSMYCIHCGKHA